MVVREKVSAMNGGIRVLCGVFHTIATSILGHVQLVKETLHQWSWNGSPSDDARAQVRGVETGRLRDAEDGFKHGGHTMQSCTFLIGDGVQDSLGIKGLAGEDNLGAVGHHRQHAQN